MYFCVSVSKFFRLDFLTCFYRSKQNYFSETVNDVRLFVLLSVRIYCSQSKARQLDLLLIQIGTLSCFLHCNQASLFHTNVTRNYVITSIMKWHKLWGKGFIVSQLLKICDRFHPISIYFLSDNTPYLMVLLLINFYSCIIFCIFLLHGFP